MWVRVMKTHTGNDWMNGWGYWKDIVSPGGSSILPDWWILGSEKSLLLPTSRRNERSSSSSSAQSLDEEERRRRWHPQKDRQTVLSTRGMDYTFNIWVGWIVQKNQVFIELREVWIEVTEQTWDIKVDTEIEIVNKHLVVCKNTRNMHHIGKE